MGIGGRRRWLTISRQGQVNAASAALKPGFGLIRRRQQHPHGESTVASVRSARNTRFVPYLARRLSPLPRLILSDFSGYLARQPSRAGGREGETAMRDIMDGTTVGAVFATTVAAHADRPL
jgi:hypothetical protein